MKEGGGREGAYVKGAEKRWLGRREEGFQRGGADEDWLE